MSTSAEIIRALFRCRSVRTVLGVLIVVISVVAGVNVQAVDDLALREWTIDSVKREALIHIPAGAKTNAVPVVFVFHGHGGSMRNASLMFRTDELWPEALVVYMQGLNTPGRLTDPEGKRPGWQKNIGDQGDRDLKFFDAVFASLKKEYKIDTKRVFATGHSNGGAFSYLLWAARPDDFTAFAPSSSLDRELIALPVAGAKGTNKTGAYMPKPLFHVAGEKDPLVKFEWQKEMIDAVRKRNQCGEGEPWGGNKKCTRYKSKIGADVITYIHPGGHTFPSEARELVVRFFKEVPSH